eukprot:6365553-Prymnesium_polylepis.1
MPASDAHETASHARSAHEQRAAVHSTTCTHSIQSHMLCAHVVHILSRARTDPTNAPASRHPSAHTVAPQHALPTLPLLGSR